MANEGNAKTFFEKQHKAAYSEAKGNMPKLDLMYIIKRIFDVYRADDRQKAVMEAAKEFAEKYKKPVQIYVEAFAANSIQDILKNIKYGEFEKLGNKEFAESVVNTAKEVSKVIKKYIDGDIEQEELIKAINVTGIGGIAVELLKAGGVNTEILKAVSTQYKSARQALDAFAQNVPAEMVPPEAMATAASCVALVLLSTYAFTEAYKIYAAAANDAAFMHEERLRIEEECNKSIAAIKEYRELINEAASDYLFEHATAFNAGIEAMDKAIIEGDIEGYISGNVIIQEYLGYDIQFRNQQEFDNLMESDEAFKL